MTPEKVVGRLSIYRRRLEELARQGFENVFSHVLAKMAGCKPAQVRRDLMVVRSTGSTKHGYNVRELLQSIGDFLDPREAQAAALIGIGGLGRAILGYFEGRRPKLFIAAAFDSDPTKIGTTMNGCPCYPDSQLPQIIAADNISIVIITTPADAAQAMADIAVAAGVKGILNFAPVTLKIPEDVFVENSDMTVYLERVAYFSRQNP